jgi:hypothetical protein
MTYTNTVIILRGDFLFLQGFSNTNEKEDLICIRESL